MGKKGKTYLLLAVVLGIWGIIGIKILGAVNPKPTEDLHPKMARAFTPQKIKQRDTFAIAANYRDPFLGKVFKKPLPARTPKKHPKKTTPKTPERPVAYTGYIAAGTESDNLYF
ncbi:MAG: hypothetical protein AB3N16_15050 [Flavobacteriaceae bacterium]